MLAVLVRLQSIQRLARSVLLTLTIQRFGMAVLSLIVSSDKIASPDVLLTCWAMQNATSNARASSLGSALTAVIQSSLSPVNERCSEVDGTVDEPMLPPS